MHVIAQVQPAVICNRIATSLLVLGMVIKASKESHEVIKHSVILVFVSFYGCMHGLKIIVQGQIE
jgi:hypothetical protein